MMFFIVVSGVRRHIPVSKTAKRKEFSDFIFFVNQLVNEAYLYNYSIGKLKSILNAEVPHDNFFDGTYVISIPLKS